MQTVARVKGTQDFINNQLFRFIIDEFENHAELYHFQIIETPIIEHVELFKRTLGSYTDVVSKEMFLISSGDKGDLLCLRPEATAPTMRAFLEIQPLTAI